MRPLLSVTLLSLLGSTAFAQAPVPKGPAPHLGLASAAKKDGKVVLEIFELREVVRMKLPNGGDVFVEKRHWSPLATGVLGQDIRAYRLDGNQASPKEVLNALAKPSAVAYFIGFDKKSEPNPTRFI